MCGVCVECMCSSCVGLCSLDGVCLYAVCVAYLWNFLVGVWCEYVICTGVCVCCMKTYDVGRYIQAEREESSSENNHPTSFKFPMESQRWHITKPTDC